MVKGGSFVSHMGQVHNEVEKYLPDIAKIPISVQVGTVHDLIDKHMIVIIGQG